jgi:hypothetical protein
MFDSISSLVPKALSIESEMSPERYRNEEEIESDSAINIDKYFTITIIIRWKRFDVLDNLNSH